MQQDEKQNNKQSAGLSLTNLGCSRGGKRIISRVTLGLAPGTFNALLGPSGCGKSTLLKTIAGIYTPSEGTVRFGQDACGSAIAYVPQDDQIHESLSIISCLEYALRLRVPFPPQGGESWFRQRADQVCGQLGLGAISTRRISSLSGGQRKRVSLGVELLTSPGLLLLDEPTSGLDPATEREIMTLLRTISRQGTTILMTTHCTDSLPLTDSLLMMKDGLLVFSGTHVQALSHFQAKTWEELFSLLKKERVLDLENRFRELNSERLGQP